MKIFVEKQTDMNDCAAACLSSIIRYYQGYVPTTILKEMMCTNKNGTTAYHLMECAKKIGFYTKAVRCSFEELIHQTITFPVIVHVCLNHSLMHYIVLYKIDKKQQKITIMDPAFGKRILSFSEFQKIFQGILILLEKTKVLPVYEKVSMEKLVFQLVLKKKKGVILLILISFLYSIGNLAIAFSFQTFIEGFINRQEFYWTIITIGAVFTFLLLSYGLRGHLMLTINRFLDQQIFSLVSKQLLLLPYRYYKNLTTGEILQRINDVDMIKSTFINFIMTFFVEGMFLFLSFLAMCYMNISLSIIPVLYIIFNFLEISFFHKSLQERLYSVKTSYGAHISYLNEVLRGFETIKGLHLQKEINQRLHNNYQEYYEKSKNLSQQYYYESICQKSISYFSTLLLLFLGGMQVLEKTMNLGSFITFFMLFQYFIGPLENIVAFENIIRDCKMSLHRLGELFQIKKEVLTTKLSFENYTIQIQDLSFSYDQVHSVLNNINLLIQEGEKVLLTGESGIGKSTLLKLLMKYYELPKGKLFLGKEDIQNYSIQDIRSNIVYVSQQGIIFSDTLEKNLIFESCQKDKLMRIIKILEVPFQEKQQLQTLFEESGSNLSGGERQRILLARALLLEKQILLLDESLSEVNIDMERRILKSILKEYPKKTILMVSHRMNNMDLFDTVVKFNQQGIEKITRNYKRKGGRSWKNYVKTNS